MHEKNTGTAPVGVVPRRHARSIEPLLSDASDTCTVAADVEPPGTGSPIPMPQWLSSVTAFGIVAAALEWLKLTR